MFSIQSRSGRGKVFGLNPNVFFLGLVSLLTDASTEMIFTLIPLFLWNVLRVGTPIIGLIGGLSESTDAVFRIFSGWVSDRLGKRKPLAVWGYSISTIAKPFMYLASSWGAVLAIRFSDRVGKGIRTSPRDALVADSVSAEERGKGFGLHRAMDTTGAFLGIVIAVLVVWLALGAEAEKLTRGVFQSLAWGCVIPGVLAVVLLQIFVREVKRKEAPRAATRFPLSGVKGVFSTRFWVFLAILAVFNLGSMPANYFVIMRAQDLGAPLLQVLLMLVLFNAVYAVVALPMGILSDRLGRRRVLALGWFIYVLVYLGFALSSTVWHVWLGFACLGIYFAIVEGVSRAFVADLAPAEMRGTAYGLYYCVVGVCVLAGGVIGGVVWDVYSPAATFYFGAALAFLAMLGIVTLIKE